MKMTLPFFLSILLVYSCTTFKKNAELVDFIPQDSFAIVTTNTTEDLVPRLNVNPIIKTLYYNKNTDAISTVFKHVSFFNDASPLLICFSKSNNVLEHTFITKYDNVKFLTDSITKHKTKTTTIKHATVFKTTFDKTPLYSIIKDSIVISSTSKPYLTSIILEENTPDPTLQKMAAMPRATRLTNIIINTKQDTLIRSICNNNTIPFSKFANYLSFDADIQENTIQLNGIAKATDSTESFINCFKNTIPQENKLATITPADADYFLSITFNDFKPFKQNLNAFNNNDTIPKNMGISLFENSNEIGVIQHNNSEIVALHSTDYNTMEDALAEHQQRIETFRGITLFKFNAPKLFQETLQPLITFQNANIYFQLNDFFIFTSTKKEAHHIITNYQNKTTLHTKNYYTKLKTDLSDEASFLEVFSPKALQQLLKRNNINVTHNNDHYKASAIQFIYDSNFAHFNMITKKEGKRTYQNSVSEEFNITLDAPVFNTPQFVTNYTNTNKDILIQDITHKLYLISNSGKIIWKKQLDGPVLGKIEQIDMYKNGRLQFVFATPNRVYLIPRSGKKVAPFPLQFKDNITQPLSVFDYDKKRNYRLLVSQGKNVLMYNSKGKIVRGFTFKKAKSTIIAQPKHFRIRNKDFIVLKTEKHLHILSRTGKPKIIPKIKDTYSKEDVYLNKGVITTTTIAGDIIRIDHKGGVSRQRKHLSYKHHIDASSKTLVTLEDNKLTIRNHVVELDFGTYTKPKIFYINNKIYVTVTDTQTQRIYLFDSLGKMINNFPIYGTSIIDLANIDKDNALEMVTKGEDNSIIVYEIN